jgi:hypothetical protein
MGILGRNRRSIQERFVAWFFTVCAFLSFALCSFDESSSGSEIDVREETLSADSLSDVGIPVKVRRAITESDAPEV